LRFGASSGRPAAERTLAMFLNSCKTAPPELSGGVFYAPKKFCPSLRDAVRIAFQFRMGELYWFCVTNRPALPAAGNTPDQSPSLRMRSLLNACLRLPL
jgi:hypothetical protein